MIEFNYQPFSDNNYQEGEKTINQETARLATNSKYQGLRPRNGYYLKANHNNNHSQSYWYEPPINQTYYMEPKQKSYWWLWLFPILGILILAYWYWKDDIDVFIEKSLRPMEALKTNDKTPKIL
ncbi:MAG: hypothetical protein CFE21_18410 [Bacteroidetes bacterium B1(2017)]|nr:MAG: hypothetical protein CFE21_18410 [Bacteroidetes bacterium B1(2017)]